MAENCEVDKILNECLATHKLRDMSYGWDAFENTAKIASILLNRNFSAYEAAITLAAHKLARYTYQREQGNERGLADTVRDLINFLALAERERVKDVNKERTITTPKAAPRPRDRNPEHTDLSGIKPYVPESKPNEGSVPKD